MNFIPALGIHFRIANSRRRWSVIFWWQHYLIWVISFYGLSIIPSHITCNFYNAYCTQCCGSGSGIPCLFVSWIRDTGTGCVKSQDSDPRWTAQILFPRAEKPFFWVKIHILWCGSGFWDEKNSYPGSGMEKMDPGWTSRIRNTDCTNTVLIQCITYACPSGVDGAGAAVAPAAHTVERGGGPVRVRALLWPGLLQPGGRPRHCRTLQRLFLPLPSGAVSQASQVAIDSASSKCFWCLSILLCRRMLDIGIEPRTVLFSYRIDTVRAANHAYSLNKERTGKCPNQPKISNNFVMVNKSNPQEFSKNRDFFRTNSLQGPRFVPCNVLR